MLKRIPTVLLITSLATCGPARPDVNTGDDKDHARPAPSYLVGGDGIPVPPKPYVGPWQEEGPKPKSLEKAEKQFAKKNYKKALEAYELFVSEHTESYWVPHASFQRSRCHYQLSEYDEALDVLNGFIDGKPGLLWEARARVRLSHLHHDLPTSGYERDGRIYYNYEHNEGEYRYMWEENRTRAVELLEEARLAYLSILAAPEDLKGTSEGDDLQLEAVDTDFLLLRDVDDRYWDKNDPCPPQPSLEPPDAEEPYDPRWTAREKMLYLYEEIPRINRGCDDTHPAAWATFKKALFLMRYPECAPAQWQEDVEKQRESYESALREKWEDREGKSSADVYHEQILEDLKDPGFRPPRWDPGPELDPMSLIQSILQDHPQDRRTELYEATTGRILEGRQEYLEAKKIYRQFLKDHPDSPWAGDVESSLYAMEQSSLSAWVQEFTYTGGEGRMDFSTRNVEKVEVEIFRVDLAKELKNESRLDDPHSRFTDLRGQLGDEYVDVAKKLDDRVWSAGYTTKDQGDHRAVSGFMKLPDLPLGFYLVKASAGKQDVLRPWLRTDVVIVGKSLEDEFRYVVTDAVQGAPLADFPVLIKEVYEKRTPDHGWKYEVKIQEAVTDESGRYTYELTGGEDVSYNRVQLLAHRKDRLAMTQDYSGPYWYGSETGKTFRIFTVTDRPVYRPGDTIRFKHIVRAYDGGKNRHVKGQKIHMEVTNPRGEKILEQTQKASAFGNAWGEVTVGEEAPLGSYHARAWVEGHQYRSYQSSGSYFRVEEYKKPEFEVKVTPSKSLATAGDDVHARIEATYYFGAPVTEAQVEYRIFRSVFTHRYVPPNRWDWLYGSGFGIIDAHLYSYGEDLVHEGEGVTDDLGVLQVKLPQIEEELDHDYEYRIVAHVTDPSRRVISGSGSLKVTRTPYYAYIVPTHGFYTSGDEVEVELLALTPDDQPVPAQGTLQVFRLEYPVAQEVKEIPFWKADISLDDAGRAFETFDVDEEGQYRLVFTSTHDGSVEVLGEKMLNVAGEKMAAKHFRFENLQVTSQKRTYLRGENIRMLVQSPWEDATLWVTYEGGDEVFHDEVYRPGGVGLVLEVEATEKLHPNFFVRVTAVREGMVYTVTREMFIPPGEEILDVKVETDRGEYKPRQEGELRITVKDHDGKPVRGELSLSVFDRSVLYIQQETAGDVRAYYYGDRRYNDVREFHSGQIWLSSWYRDRTKWPEFEISGLPDPSGWFQQIFHDRALYYTCPSCEAVLPSPWRFYLPEERKEYMEGLEATGEPMDPSAAITFNGGDGQPMVNPQMASVPAAKSSPGGFHGAGKGGGGGKLKKDSMKLAEAEEVAMDEVAFEDIAEMDGHKGPDAEMVREKFADTALWVPDVVTNKKGRATVDIQWPDNLTTWAVRVVGVDGKARVGLARTSAVTTKKLVARIETPRFMVEGDRLTLAAVVNNAYPEDREVKLALELTGGVEYADDKTATITVPAGKDARHDFHVRAVEASEVSVKLTAVTEDDSDALIKRLEVMEWGSDRMVTRTGAMRDSGKMTLTLDLPDERRKDTTEFVLALDPSVAGVVLQSLPYLIHYPYGCVEQTMSRFLPAAMVARTLKDLGIKLDEIPELASKATLADPVGGAHGAPQTCMNEPIYDEAELQKIIKLGLERLYSFQHADGGWAWWREGPSDPYMTAYVVSGLWEASEAGYDVDDRVIGDGMEFLDREYRQMSDAIEKKAVWHDVPLRRRHLMTYMAYVLSLDGRVKMKDIQPLHDHREALTHYGRSLLALTLHQLGETDEARLAVQNLADVAWADDASGTASFKFEAKQWWRWYENRVETVAWALRAFTAIDPDHEYGPMFARWLVNNRQGNRWFSTRDTALAMLALNDYMTAHDEFDPDHDVTVKVNGKQVLAYHQGKKNIFSGQGRVILRGDEIEGNELRVQVQTKGKGAIYANAFLSYFTREKVIEGTGNEIFVERHYYRLEEVKKTEDTWHGKVTKIDYERHELEPGDPVDSGDLVEVRILIESKNDYEYLVFEDYKPAGFEPVALKSGGIYQHGTWINREMRDEKVVNFLYSLEQGKQALTYKMRAEIPGDFGVLPHRAYAMYAPRVKAISDSWQITVSP